MSCQRLPLDLPVCVVCGTQFNLEDKLPITQACHHSICAKCLDTKSPLNCPADNEPLDMTTDRTINQSIIKFLFGKEPQVKTDTNPNGIAEIEKPLGELALLLREQTNEISPQQARRLLQLITSSYQYKNSRLEFVRRISSLFNRLLLELIQAHYNTKQRERDLVRLLNAKGCYILEPDLTDAVIDLLIRLYKAAGQCADTSFERNVLIKFLLKELGDDRKRPVERIVQTLLWCNCFYVTKRDDAPSRYSLKESLHNASDLRQQHDIEIIRKARDKQNNLIRLSPESWAYLLHGRSIPGFKSRMQSMLDKHQAPATVDELRDTIFGAGDLYGIEPYIDDLRYIQDLITRCLACQPDAVCDLKIVRGIMEKLAKLKHLLTIRQCRAKLAKFARK